MSWWPSCSRKALVLCALTPWKLRQSGHCTHRLPTSQLTSSCRAALFPLVRQGCSVQFQAIGVAPGSTRRMSHHRAHVGGARRQGLVLRSRIPDEEGALTLGWRAVCRVCRVCVCVVCVVCNRQPYFTDVQCGH
jgi:hypothetical protein